MVTIEREIHPSVSIDNIDLENDNEIMSYLNICFWLHLWDKEDHYIFMGDPVDWHSKCSYEPTK